MIKSGIDPKNESRSAGLEHLRKQENTFAAVAEEFIKRHVPKTRKAKEVERDIRREFVDEGRVRSQISRGMT